MLPGPFPVAAGAHVGVCCVPGGGGVEVLVVSLTREEAIVAARRALECEKRAAKFGSGWFTSDGFG